MKKLVMATAAAAMVSGGAVWAAQDGTTGPSSSGDFDVSLSIGKVVVVKNLDDVNFGNFGAGATPGVQTLTEHFCIGATYQNTVDISMSSANPGPNTAPGEGWRMAGTLGGFLPYSVSLARTSDAVPTGFDQGDTKNLDLSDATDARSLTCSSDNITLTISTDPDGAPSDGYQDTVSLVVAAI